MSGGWVYIMTNRPNGVLYIGVVRRSSPSLRIRGRILPKWKTLNYISTSNHYLRNCMRKTNILL